MAIRFKHRVLKYADFIFKFSKGFKTDYIVLKGWSALETEFDLGSRLRNIQVSQTDLHARQTRKHIHA